MAASINPADLESFQSVLRYSDRILALCGAGLSAASGLPTFRGAGGIWRSHAAVQLATPEAFRENPGLVWHFYNYRRHMALGANPNAAHYALAELARRKKGFLTLTQNVDGRYLNSHHQRQQMLTSFQDSAHALATTLERSSTSMAPSLTSNARPSSAITRRRTTTSILSCLHWRSQKKCRSPHPRVPQLLRKPRQHL